MKQCVTIWSLSAEEGKKRNAADLIRGNPSDTSNMY